MSGAVMSPSPWQIVKGWIITISLIKTEYSSGGITQKMKQTGKQMPRLSPQTGLLSSASIRSGTKSARGQVCSWNFIFCYGVLPFLHSRVTFIQLLPKREFHIVSITVSLSIARRASNNRSRGRSLTRSVKKRKRPWESPGRSH